MSKKISTIIFPIFCLMLSFFILITDSHYTYSLVKEEHAQPTKELVHYLVWQGQMPEVFNAEEQLHLQDVKQLIKYAFITFLLTILVLIYCSSELKKAIRQGTILLLAILGACFVIPFEVLFTKFHQIFFPQGNWIFPPDSTLITFYPANFFATYALSIAVYAIFLALILTHFTYFVSRKG
ncbi:DUF1461 domain-containing protein [Candidatus Woesearchaeota archaeon]|nr:DUF1461 domain-containing protein [Candidatus Woesearchaeota archaeon]MBW3016708.1 DUF1461 domain-containing protein [Candidatus Woesearchaeota archaeon]